MGEVLTEQQASLLDDMPSSVAIVDTDGVIRVVNRGWREFAVANGRPDPERDIGWSYHQWVDSSDPTAAASAAGVLDMISGSVDEFSFAYPCHSPVEQRWFQFLAVPLQRRAPRPVLIAHLRVGEHVAAQLDQMTVEALRRLEGIVTVCAWCNERQIDMSGEWVGIGRPPPDSDMVSHGICPTCLSALDRT